jgi:hypothetical protein
MSIPLSSLFLGAFHPTLPALYKEQGSDASPQVFALDEWNFRVIIIV